MEAEVNIADKHLVPRTQKLGEDPVVCAAMALGRKEKAGWRLRSPVLLLFTRNVLYGRSQEVFCSMAHGTTTRNDGLTAVTPTHFAQ